METTKKRIGKDIYILCKITFNGGEPFTADDQKYIQVELKDRHGNTYLLPSKVTEDGLLANFQGERQKLLGAYMMTVWFKRGYDGTTCADLPNLFELVETTLDDTGEDMSVFENETIVTSISIEYIKGEFLKVIAKCEDATEKAVEATKDATEKAQLAEQKANLADEKARLAKEATDRANSASAGAEKVNAQLNGSVVEVTDRNGNKSSVDLNDAFGGRVTALENSDAKQDAELTELRRKVGEIEGKTEDIEKGRSEDEADAVVFEDNDGNEVGKITPEGANFKELKSNDKPVVTSGDFIIEDGKAKKVVIDGEEVPFGNDEVEVDANAVAYDNGASYDEGSIGKAVQGIGAKINTEEADESVDAIVFASDDKAAEYVRIDKEGIHAKNIYDMDGNKYNRSCKTINHIGDSTSGGILAQGSITYYIRKYAEKVGYGFNGYGRGGESTDSMMAYLGCGGMILNEALTIPASGSVTFSPKSSLIDKDGKLMYFGSFAQFGNEQNRVPINEVSINGIKGTISASQARLMAGVVFYNASGYKVYAISQDDYAKDITSLSFSATKMRVCINAPSAADVANASCHVSINGQAIELKAHINTPATYLNNNGGLVSEEGFYCSEEIDISNIGTITNIYADGLATATSITFTRKESGEATIVEKGTRVIADTAELGKSGVITAYINNFRKTGKDIADDWAEQMHKILEYSDDKKFIFGSSHYFGNDYSQEDIDKIEGRLKVEFGERYFSGYEYLKDCGIQDVVRFGVLTQQQVNDAIANGNQNLPAWQRPFQNATYGDFLHFNEYAMYLIARKFITIGIKLGYWSEADYSYNSFNN